MKYGDKDTFSYRQVKRHGHTLKPAMSRYFKARRWITNKLRNIEKNKKKAGL